MKRKINYLGFLSVLSLVAIIGFFRRDNSQVFTFLVFLSYLGYFQVTPDEMFRLRVYKSSGVALLLTLIVMVGFFVGFLITQEINYFSNGFWISFTVLIVSFPFAFLFFQMKEE